MVGEQVERPVHAAEHAEPQHIDLHEFQNIDIILVPFDDLPLVHPGGLYRHEIVEPVLGQHETAIGAFDTRNILEARPFEEARYER